MPVVNTDIQLFEPATRAADITTTNLGGAITTTQITGGTVGEVLFLMASGLAGNPAQVQIQKLFVKNTNPTSNLNAAVVYIENGLNPVSTTGVASFGSSSASDDSTQKIRVLGFNGATAQMEDVPLNGVASVNGLLTFTAVNRTEKRNVTTNALTAAVGTITHSVGGVTLGVMPAGLYTTTSEIRIWLEGTLDGATTNGSGNNCTVPPTGATFSSPNTPGTGLAVANGQVLTAGHAQAVWVQWTLAATALPSDDFQVSILTFGASGS